MGKLRGRDSELWYSISGCLMIYLLVLGNVAIASGDTFLDNEIQNKTNFTEAVINQTSENITFIFDNQSIVNETEVPANYTNTTDFKSGYFTNGTDNSVVFVNDSDNETINNTTTSDESVVLRTTALPQEPIFKIQSLVGGVAREGFLTQSGTYNFVGTDEFIPLTTEILNLSHAFIIAPNLMNQENTTAGSSGDPATNSDDSFVSLYLYNSTHIRAQRGASDDGPVVVTWQVIEAMDEEFQVQRGNISYSGTNLTISDTIPSAVNPDNAMSWFYIDTTYNANRGDVIQFYSNIVDNTTIEFTREDSAVSTSVNFRWEVIEWNMEKINNFIKGYTGEITGPNTSPDCFNLGTTINKSSSFLFHQSHAVNDNDGGLDTSTRAGYIQDDNTVCFYDFDGGYTAAVKWFVVDFQGVTQREENIHTDWATTDYFDNISFSGSYNTNNSLFFVSGTCNGDGTAKPRHTQWSYLTGGTTTTGMNIERTYGGQNREYAWQIIELPYFENSEVPTFSNMARNNSFVGLNDVVRFSVDVADASDSIVSVNGTVDGVLGNFIYNTGNEWYYDFTCVKNEDVSFSYVEAVDSGHPVRGSNQTIFGINTICDTISPVVTFISPDTPDNESSLGLDYFDVNVSVVETNFKNVTFNLYNNIGEKINSQSYIDGTRNHRFTGLFSGTYFYNVTAYDLAGNIGYSETREIYIDSENPLISFNGLTKNSGEIISGTEFPVSVNIIEPNFKNVTFYLYNEFGELERPATSYTDSTRSIFWTLLSDGLYYYNVTAYDNYGHFNFTETRNITIDNVKPVVSYETGTEADGSYFARDWGFVNVSYVEDYYKNVTFELWNSSGFSVQRSAFSDGTRSINWSGLGDDVYFYNVTVCDLADNCGGSGTRKITLDNVNPVVNFGTGTAINNANFSRDWIFIDASLIEPNFANITFEIFNQAGGVDIQTFTDGTRNFNFTDLVSGIYDYNITVYDKAGNKGVSSTRSIGLDLVGPSISIISPQPKAYGNGVDMSLTYSVSDAIAGVDSCWFNVNNGANTTVDCGGYSNFTVGDGSHTVYFYSNDTFGNLGQSQVSFLVSTTGPAVTLNDPINDAVYNSSKEIFFNYSAIDSDGVESCSLWENFNGTWLKNQTDFSFGLVGNDTDRTCSDVWGSDCGVENNLELNNIFDDCTNNANTDEKVNDMWLSATEIIPGKTINITCNFDVWDNDDLYMWYYNGTGWRNIYQELNINDGTTTVNRSTSFVADDVVGTHWVRCGLTYDVATETDACSDTGSYFDNDDVNFTVVAAKEEGNFTTNIASEGNYKWNVKCNDSLSYVGTAINNYSVAVDLTNPVVGFDTGTLVDNSRVGVDWIFVSANVTENNFNNITFTLSDQSSVISSQTFNDGTRNYTFVSLNDGNYDYNITVYDKAGHVGISETRGIELDTTKPSGSSNTPSNGYFTKDTSQNLTAIVNDSVELKDATLFIFNSTGQMIYSSLVALVGVTTATIGVVYNFLYDDVFSWFYRVRDSVNNEYNTTAHSIEIDKSGPVVNFISSTEMDGDIFLRDWIFVNISVYEKNYKNITFWLYNSKGIVSPSPNTFSDSTRSINWTLLSDDVYQYNVTSYDLAGNEGFSETREIILDTIAPEVSFNDGSKMDGTVISGTEISVGVDVVEANEKNIIFSLYDDSLSLEKSEVPYSDKRRDINWTNLPDDGIYFYNVTVTDLVLQKGFSETREIILDNVFPVVNYVLPTKNNKVNISQNWIFVNTTVDELNFANITFTLTNQSSIVSSQSFDDNTRAYNFTGLSNGIYFYNVTVYDKAGHVVELESRSLTVDTIVPQVDFELPTENSDVIRNRDWIFVNVSTNETNFKNITFILSDESSTVSSQSFDDNTRAYNFTGISDGNYKYNVTVYDWSGNLGYTETRNIGLDTAAPIVNIINPKSKTYGYNESLLLENVVSDRVSNIDSCWWNIDEGTNISTACNSVITFNTTVADHIINFYANDTFGNIGQDSVSFFISITGPAIELVVPKNNSFYGSAENITFSFAANDPDGVDTCSLYGDWSGSWAQDETYLGNWYDVGFKHRKNINISNAGASALINYPLYLNITSAYTDSGDYYDLRFFNGSCDEEQFSLLNYEVEYYDATSADVWVSVPSLPVTGTTLCMYYGNDDAEDAENITGVWNSDYAMVYHMDSAGQDSTSNNRDRPALSGNPSTDNSFLGEGISFSDGNAWDLANLAWWEAGYSTRTHEAVFETSGDVNTRQVIFAEGGGTNGIMMYILSGELYVRWWISSQDHYVSTPIQSNTKYHAVMTYENGGIDTYAFYLNGVQVGSGIPDFDIAAHSGDGAIGYTGGNSKDFQDTDNIAGYYFTGSIYEFRGMDNFQTNDWANQTYQMIFDDSDIVNYGVEKNFTAFIIPVSQEGSYNWNIKCNDTIGYDSYALDNYTFIVDVTNPQVFFGAGTEEDKKNVGRNWIFIDTNIIENNFKNITFTISDGSSIVDIKSFNDNTREYNFTGLDSGSYYYNVSVYDEAGHVGSSPTRSIKLDLVPPTGNLDFPSTGSYVKNLVQNLTASFSDATGLSNATLYVLNESGSIIFTGMVVLSGVLTATAGIIYNFVSEGIYSWFYRVVDVVGNEQNTTSNILTVDVTAPLIDYAPGTEDSGCILGKDSIYVNVTSSDLYWRNITFNLFGPSGHDSYVFIDGVKEINWNNLEDGFYEYNVTAYDFAGNSNTTEMRNITLDNLFPEINFAGGTKVDGAFISGDTISIDVDVVEANEKNISFNLYNNLGINVRSNTYDDLKRSVSWNLLNDGYYYYNVTVYDKVGNFASTETRLVIIDNVNPIITYAYGTEDNNSTFARDWIYSSVNVVETNFKNVSLSLYNSTGLVSTEIFSDTTRAYNWTGLSDGNYWYNATTYDKAGNKAELESRSLTLDNVNPLISFTIGTENNNFNKTDSWIFVNTSIIENNFNNITYELRDVNGIINSTTYTFLINSINWTDLDSKVYWYNVTIYDKAGNKNETESRSIGLDYLGPDIFILNPQAKAYGYNISLPLNYNVNDAIVGNDVCWYNLDFGNNETVDCYSSTTFNTSDGQHSLYFYANDTLGNLGYKNVTFLISTTGPAIQLIEPEDNSFYSQPTEVFFNYAAEDPDLTQGCSLWGDWNGGWHLNQTDFDWNKLNNLNKTCSEIWGFDCSVQPDQDNTFDDCETGANSDEAVDEIWINVTDIKAGDTVNAICQFSVWDTDNLYMWYYNGTGWRKLMQDLDTTYGTTTINKSVVFVADDNPGTHWVRCGLTYGSATETDACSDTGSYYDNDDINFTVIKARTNGNFTLNLSEEGTYNWNIECNDSRGYYTWAATNYSITFDVTNPIVDFGVNTLINNSNVSQNFIYVNSSILENNFKNITFVLSNESSVLETKSFNDSTRDYTFLNLADGIYFYKIIVFDSANRNGSSSAREVLLDTKEPVGSLGTPSDNVFSNNDTQNLTGTFSDENGLKKVVLFIFNDTNNVYSQVVLLSGALTATVGIVYKFLIDGVYNWFYQAEDLVGNLYNTTNNTLVIDTISPVVNFTGGTREDGEYVSQNFIYVNTTVVESNFKNITFGLYNSDGIVSPSPNTFIDDKRDINWTNLPDDEYYYNVTAWDIVGNMNTTKTRNITLDNILPQMSYATGTEVNNYNASRDWIFVNTSVIETNFANITFRLYNDIGLVDSTSFSNSTRDINWTLLDDGKYYYNVTVWDMAGLKKDLSTRKINLDMLKPLVDFASLTEEDGTQFERDWIYIDVNIVETNFKNMSYRLYDNESQLINATSYNMIVNNINFTASGENKTYFYDIVVYDYAGNKGQTILRNITLIDVTSPGLVLISPENITYPYNDSLRLSYEASDIHLDSCWYSLDYGANITLPNCQGTTLSFPDETGHTINLYVNDTMGYVNTSIVTFFVNSSLIETPTYKVIRGFTFVDGVAGEEIETTDMSKSFILYNLRGSDNGADTLNVISNFVSSHEISFSNDIGGGGVIVDWSVISGPDIRVQRGEVNAGNDLNITEKIATVNLSNSFIIVNSKVVSGDASDNRDGSWSAKFINDSNIVFNRGDSSAESVISWQVVAWKGVSVESGNLNIEAGSQMSQTNIRQVDLNKSVLIFSHSLGGADNVEDLMIKGNFTNESEVKFSRIGNTGNINVSYFVLESNLFDVQTGEYTHLLNSDAQSIGLSKDLVSTRRTFDIHSHENEGATTAFASGFVTQTIENNKSLVLQKGVGSGAGETSWFTVEIKDLNAPIVNLTNPIDDINYTTHIVGDFNFVIEEESNISNCSLYGSWNGGWHLNQSIYAVNSEIENSFNSVDVGINGFYNWSVECFDIYANKGVTNNYTFSSYLPTTEPEFANITQSNNNGTGNISLAWKVSDNAVKYKIYYSNNLTNFVLLAETTKTNYTDTTFEGNKRRFYKVEAWNPSSTNMSNYVFGADVYELKHNVDAKNIKNRNWIGFPINFSYLKNANDSLSEITGITSISRLDSSTQKQVSCTEFSCPESFACTETACNFDLNPGEGYEVSLNLSGASSVNWSGVGIVYEPVQVNLVYDETGTRFNNNWISMYAGTELFTASSLKDSLLGEDTVTRWNAELQESEGRIELWPGVYIGTNFDINIEEGFEVSVIQDSAWVQQ